MSHHEAGHSVMNYLHGWRLGPIVLRKIVAEDGAAELRAVALT